MSDLIDDIEDRKKIERDRMMFGTAMWEEQLDGSVRHIPFDSEKGRAIEAAYQKRTARPPE